MDITKEIRALIEKAERTDKADEALKFSQAAQNAANAMAVVINAKVYKKESARS